MRNFAAWLRELGLGQYESVFAANDIDAEILPELTDGDLQTLGLSLGHRKKLLKAIAALENSPLGVTAKPTSTDAERRQLTVMFCDLVGSTALAERHDPEDFREVIHDFQVACSNLIVRYDGTVAKYMGDGILAYFGYPHAHEDDAERAIRSALGMIEAVKSLSDRKGGALSVRIGIATGLVVVGDTIGEGAAQEQAVVGETPNLAARLQSIAAQDTVVIGATTRDLSGRQFHCIDLGRFALKGISEPVPAWQVTGERAVETRFGALHGERLTNLVGRDQEIGLLAERWSRAKAGEGQLALLAGEAGIGKSSIAATLHRKLTAEGIYAIQYQCSPHHTNSPLYPVIQQIVFAAGISGEDAAETKLDKLEQLMARSQSPQETVHLLAMLLSIPTSGRHAPLNLSPEEQKQRTLRALLDELVNLAGRLPVFLVLEDAHWIDPTTRELMDLLIECAATLRVFVLVTHRPEFAATWSAHSHATVLTLNRLGRSACSSIVNEITGGRAMPAEVLEQIAARTDGVPLFVEELTKTILESGLLAEGGDRYVVTKPQISLTIPTTLQDSLMARLDRLREAKEIAQIGAAIGREFSHTLIEAVSPLKGQRLDAALEALRNTEIVFRRGTPPNASYVFKHALIQDTAYDTLLRSRRQQIHERIAAELESGFPEIISNEPETLAHHLTRAGAYQQAAHYWLLAGRRAIASSATQEAVSQLSAGLDTLGHLPPSSEKRSLELDIQIGLGSAWIANRGYSATETEGAYARAKELIAEMGGDPRHSPILHGLSMVFVNRGEHEKVLTVGREMLDWAGHQADSLPLLAAHRVSAVGNNFLGHFEQARDHAHQATLLYDPCQHGTSAHQFGHDQGVGAWWHLSIANHFLADYPAALAANERALALANELNHANTTLYGHLWNCFTSILRGDAEAAHGIATLMIDDATHRSMALWVVFGRFLLGGALTGLARHADALREFENAKREAGLVTNVMLRLTGLRFEAEALAGLGRTGDALDCLDAAKRHIAATNERWWEPEIHRLRGEILLDRGDTDTTAENCFQQAVAVARHQKSLAFELRAAIRLARLWRNRGQEPEATELITPLSRRFPPTIDNADLRLARAFLTGLRARM